MDHMEGPKRVLHIVSTMDRGGAETLLMNVYRNLDRSRVQFDFVTHSPQKGDFDDEIRSLGGKIHQIPSLGELGPIGYIKELVKVMNSQVYAAVHSHTDYQGGFPALAAKVCGIHKRICHSHSNDWPQGKNIKAKVMLKVLQTMIRMSATDYCSCSTEAAAFLFGKIAVRHKRVKILKNAIDINHYVNLKNCRESVIREFNLPNNSKIIGHVGRFSESKNQLFILKVLKKILEENPSYTALLVGEGPLKSQIEKEAKNLGVFQNIRLLGIREDIPRLMKAFDVFLFPSIFEGFGIVTIEAQCAGTPCVVSDTVPKTTDMGLQLLSFVNLENDISEWAEEVKKAVLLKRPANSGIYRNIALRGYSIQENVPQWLSLYGILPEREISEPLVNL